MQTTENGDMARRLIRLKEVIARTGLRRTAIYERRIAGEFPQPIPLAKNSVAWVEDEVDAWIEARILAARAGQDESRKAGA
jgi:prophage regulatory protein